MKDVASNSGSKHWKYQRYSALILTPMILWLFVRIILHPELSYAEAKEWLVLPTSSLLMVLTIGMLWFHAAAGVQVVLEDYVSCHHIQKQLVNLVRWIAVLMTASSVFMIVFMWTQ